MKLQFQSVLAMLLGSSLIFAVGNSRAQLTGTIRSNFINDAEDKCFASQRADRRNKPFADQKLRAYCQCYSTYIADATTNKLIAEIENGDRPFSAMTWAIPLAAKYCVKQVNQ